jgi:fumarate hydratase, class II
MRLLGDACASFDEHCARGIEPQHATRSMIPADALADAGDRAGATASATTSGREAIAKHAHHAGLSLREAALTSGQVSAEQFDQWVRPQDMLAARE